MSSPRGFECHDVGDIMGYGYLPVFWQTILQTAHSIASINPSGIDYRISSNTSPHDYAMPPTYREGAKAGARVNCWSSTFRITNHHEYIRLLSARGRTENHHFASNQFAHNISQHCFYHLWSPFHVMAMLAPVIRTSPSKNKATC